MEDDKPKMKWSDEDHVLRLIEKSSLASDQDQAMKYSQAACNAANALLTLNALRKSKVGAI
jgi:hypothetical protein